MNTLLLTVGNIYIDSNILGVNAGEELTLESGKDYFAKTGERVLGGSAINVCLQAKKLGLDVGFIGKTGADEGAREVRSLLEEAGILSELVTEDSEQTTSMAINLVGTNGAFIGVHYGEASKVLDAEDINLASDLVSNAVAIYFGGTSKQALLFKNCAELFRELSERGIKIFYDPNRFPVTEVFEDHALLRTQLGFVEGYFTNEEELLQATGCRSVNEALNKVIETGVRFVALKRGAKGCLVKTAEESFTVDGKKVDPVTTVGAGDCFNATFISSYLQGKSLKECAELATTAASIKVSKNIWPSLVEISDALLT